MYQLVFSGQLADNWQQAEVLPELARLLKQPPEKAQVLFSGRRFVLAKNLSSNKARDLRLNLRKIGALADIESMPPPATSQPEPATGKPCPKCGHRQSSGDTCNACGVIFHKFLQAQQAQAVAASPQINHNSQASVAPANKRSNSGYLLIGLILCLVVGVSLMIWQKRQDDDFRTRLMQAGVSEFHVDEVAQLRDLAVPGRTTIVALLDSRCGSCKHFQQLSATLSPHAPQLAFRHIVVHDHAAYAQALSKYKVPINNTPYLVIYDPDQQPMSPEQASHSREYWVVFAEVIKEVERDERLRAFEEELKEQRQRKESSAAGNSSAAKG